MDFIHATWTFYEKSWPLRSLKFKFPVLSSNFFDSIPLLASLLIVRTFTVSISRSLTHTEKPLRYWSALMDKTDPLKPHRELLHQMHACIVANFISIKDCDRLEWSTSPWPLKNFSPDESSPAEREIKEDAAAV